MKILCFGDSNTWGYDPRGYWGGRYDRPWTDILAEMQNCTVINQGENGRQIPRTPLECPDDTDLLIIMLGTNDLLQGASPEAVCSKMEGFLKSIELEPQRILLVAPPPLKPGEWVAHQTLIDDSLRLAKLYQGLSQRLGIRFVNSETWNTPMAFDGVHMTEEGHRAFAAGLGDYLNKGE